MVVADVTVPAAPAFLRPPTRVERRAPASRLGHAARARLGPFGSPGVVKSIAETEAVALPVSSLDGSSTAERRTGSMGRLCETEGLTDIQEEILKTVRVFVDEKIIPVANELEHKDEYPTEIVEGLKELGLFGLMIPEEYGGLGESLLTYALAVEEIARGWMSVSGIINTHFIVAYMLLQHGTDEQKQKYLPRMATGEVRGAFSMSEPGCGSDVAAIKTKAVQGTTTATTRSPARRCG